ncbi:hypothetical protein ACHQM5_000364 [Ranunculus cassubicifolius]
MQYSKLNLSMKKVKPRSAHKEMVPTEVRRSARVSNLPAPVYKEDSFYDIESPRRSVFLPFLHIMPISIPLLLIEISLGRYSIHAADEDRISAIERAEELESKLESEFPSFVRPMLPTHLTGSFWLGLPSHFCNKNLPKRDETITLIDENEDEWQTIYIATRTCLSDGWREFALAHKLVDGDVLVFELVKPTWFKVYVVKVNS